MKRAIIYFMILIGLAFVSLAIGQSVKGVDTNKLNMVKIQKLDTCTNLELSLKVLKQDSVSKVQKDSLHAKDKRIHEAVKKDFWGGVNPIHYVIGFIFCFMVMFIKWSWKTGKAVKANTDTTIKFSWKLWLLNGLHKISRILAALFLVFLFMRFSKEMLGFEFSMILCVMIGFSYDYLAEKFMSIKPESLFKKDLPTV